jgi:TusA-related sulfurtransferase
MKYKLINKKTGEEHVCSKETVNGFDFYIGGVIKDIHELNVWDTTVSTFHPFLKFIGTSKYAIESFERGEFLKVIATNDPSKEIPQVVDEVEEMAKELLQLWKKQRLKTIYYE